MNTYQLTEPKAGDAWRNHIKQFEALDSWFNSLPEVTQLWLSQQIDIFAGKYPPSGEKKEDIQPVLRKFINVYEDDKGRFISDTYYETSDDAFEGRDPVNYLGTIEIIGDLPDMTNISAANREFHEQHPSKEQQKQSLVEIPEADTEK